jgi:hypothetical protein
VYQVIVPPAAVAVVCVAVPLGTMTGYLQLAAGAALSLNNRVLVKRTSLVRSFSIKCSEPATTQVWSQQSPPVVAVYQVIIPPVAIEQLLFV